MRNIVLYIVTVLIWGSTWLAIEFQLGVVAPAVSLVYRFAIAAILMWAFCWWKKLSMQYTLRDHFFFVVLACCNFGFNYLILYWAQAYLTSAMASIAFSTLLIMNIVNTRLWFGKPISGRIYVGAIVGLMGIVALFWQDINSLDWSSDAMFGLGLALGGTVVASFGNMTSLRNSRCQIGVMQGNAWGMLYGAVLLMFVVFLTGAEFNFDYALPYVASLLYLSVFGTVVAFTCYFVLLKEIGPEKASYSNIMFPVVAVALSMVFEAFVWQENTVLGFILVIVGNVIVLTPVKKITDLFRRFGVLPEISNQGAG